MPQQEGKARATKPSFAALNSILNVFKDKITFLPYPEVSNINKYTYAPQKELPWQAVQDNIHASKKASDKTGLSNTDKALYASKTKGGSHNYYFELLVNCADAEVAISKYALMAVYLLGIPGFQAMILPSHPLWSLLETAKDDPGNHIKLIKSHRTEFPKATIEVLRIAFSDKPIPQNTRIIIFSDIVVVGEHVIDGYTQYIKLDATQKHIFWEGYSIHIFEYKPKQRNKLLFSNFGEGQSAVPCNSIANVLLAGLMWSCSSRIGTEMYTHFSSEISNEDQVEELDLKSLLMDSNKKFARHMKSTIDPRIIDCLNSLQYIGYKLSPMSLYVVDIYHHERIGNHMRANQLKSMLGKYVVNKVVETIIKGPNFVAVVKMLHA